MNRGVLIFCAVFGVMASLASAWLPRIPGFDNSIVTMRSGLSARSVFATVFEQHSTWTTWIMVLPLPESSNPEAKGTECVQAERIDDLPYWMRHEAQGDRAFRIVTEATGWPMRCMRMTTRAYKDGPAEERGMLRPFAHASGPAAYGVSELLAAGDVATSFHEITLPIEAILPGMLVNVLFFGGIPAGLLTIRATAIRMRRARRGLCSACGYDKRGLSGGGCPECGDG